MDLARKLSLISFMIWNLLGFFASAQGLVSAKEYQVTIPDIWTAVGVTRAPFYSTKPDDAVIRNPAACTAQNNCRSLPSNAKIYDCRFVECGGYYSKSADLRSFGEGITHVKIVSGKTAEIGYMPTWVLEPATPEPEKPKGKKGKEEKKPEVKPEVRSEAQCDKCHIPEPDPKIIPPNVETATSNAHEISKTASKEDKNKVPMKNDILEMFSKHRKFNKDKCSNFIVPTTGGYGPWGHAMLVEMQKRSGFLDRNNGVEKNCKNFHSFSIAKKYDFFIYVMMGLAIEESACDEAAENPEATNDTGVGLFQVENSYERRKSRDDQSGEIACTSGLMKKALPNIKCAISTLNYMQLTPADKSDKGIGLFGDEDVYWQFMKAKPRFETNLPHKVVQMYPGCRPAAKGKGTK